MPLTAVDPPRTRLLDAAAALFYSDGVHVGVDALCQAAGVSKRTMYQLFATKDDLLADSLERSVPAYLAALLPADCSERPRERVLGVFDRLEGVVADPSFRGCPYVSAATEIKQPEHPARRVAKAFHDTLTRFFRDCAVELGAEDPDLLAEQLTVIHDGVTARAVVQGGPTAGLGPRSAAALLDASVPRRGQTPVQYSERAQN